MTNSSPLQLNALGWSYIGFAIIWTIGTLVVMTFLWHRRELPHLQMRRLPLVFAAICMLHVYAVLCYVAFMVGYLFPCVVEFWDMNLLLPLGIAIFQIANSQFLHVATRQKKYADNNKISDYLQDAKSSADELDSGTLWANTLRRVSIRDRITRMMIYVGIGMAIQILLSLVIFLMSEKFHRGWGLLPDDFLGTNSETRLNCARGWEWWLSIGWQTFWVWVYAPYVLFKSRNIEDTHGWRVQTICCIVVSLPASPLWLCALYVQEFATVNAVWIPPQWFALSIFFIELFTLGIPCYYVRKQHKLKADTLAALRGWEERNKFGHNYTSDSDSMKRTDQPDLYGACNSSEKGLVCTDARFSESGARSSASVRSRPNGMLTMKALDYALKWNAEPLQRFAALKDFSGENISFLTGVSSWKSGWLKRHHVQGLTAADVRMRFHDATQIYAAFVSGEYAEFPINISSSTLKKLDIMFADANECMLGETLSRRSVNSATPFDSAAGIGKSRPFHMRSEPKVEICGCTPGDDRYNGDVSPQFGPNVFDEAESEIKYLVLTNTWPKFVHSGPVGTIGDSSCPGLKRSLLRLLGRVEGGEVP